MTLVDKFWSKVRKTDGCWEWQASLKSGYGQFGPGGLAHRISYELEYGPIPPKMNVLHHCDNRLCVRPDHLFVGTQKDNMEDARGKGRLAIGEKCGSSKLNREQVIEIRRRYASGERQYVLATEYDISRPTMHSLVRGKHWSHI